MKLYCSPGAFSMAPHIVATETGTKGDLVKVDIPNKKTADQKPDAGLIAKAGTMERHHQMEALNFAATGVHEQIGALLGPTMTLEMKEVRMGTIERRLNPLEKSLEGKQFVMGDEFSVVDAYLFTVLNWANPLKIDVGAKWPNIKAYMGRVGARPKVQETLKA